jgi:hypothetical protein
MNDSPETNRRHSPNQDRATLRASDSDRGQTASHLLRHGVSEGRPSADELEQRPQATFAARIYGEPDVLASKVPSDREPNRRHRLRELLPLRLRTVVALAAPLAALMASAGEAGIGFGRSSAAAAHQPRAPANTQAQPP